MKPQYEPTTREQFYGYAIEEAGEFLHAAGKTLRWGENSTNPELPKSQRVTNIAWLRAEMRDLRGALDRLEAHLDDRCRLTNEPAERLAMIRSAETPS